MTQTKHTDPLTAEQGEGMQTPAGRTGFIAVFLRELHIIFTTPVYLICMFLLPMFVMVFFTSLMDQGQPNKMPVGIVDLDNPVYPVDFDALARAAKEQHVLLEINNSSYKPNGSRSGSEPYGRQLLAACKQHGTAVICGSDAHIDLDVGTHAYSWKLIEACGFPEELVVNTSVEKFESFLHVR